MRRVASATMIGLLALLCLTSLPQFQTWALAKKADPPPAEKKKEYEFRLIRVTDRFEAVRFKVATGESWYIDGDKFVKIPETGEVPAGDYDIQLVTDDKDWMGFRIDRISGTTWKLTGNKWVKLKEPEKQKET
jgi:hypothetical protein